MQPLNSTISSELHKWEETPPRPWLCLFCSRFGLAGMVLTGAAFALVTYALWMMSLTHSFQSTGISAEAQIVEKTIGSGAFARDQTMTFSFQTSEGVIRRTRRVGDAFYRQYVAGDAVSVQYIPSNPHRFIWEPQQYKKPTIWLLAAALAIGLFALRVSVSSALRATQAVNARRYGTPKRAVVTGFLNSGVARGRRPVGNMMWMTEDGDEGRSFCQEMANFQEASVGSEIVVFAYKGHTIWSGDVSLHAHGHEI